MGLCWDPRNRQDNTYSQHLSIISSPPANTVCKRHVSLCSFPMFVVGIVFTAQFHFHLSLYARCDPQRVFLDFLGRIGCDVIVGRREE